MKTCEKDALLDYLEFHLITLCEQVIPDYDPNKIHSLYKIAYSILDDFETTIEPSDSQINMKNR